MNLDNFFQKIIRICFYLLFIIVPLILTPWNYELFEFNKMLSVYALTAIIAGAWLGRMFIQRRILFKKTPFDIPLVLFLISQLLSTLFSIDRHTSFFGYYSRFHGGLLSTVCYLLLYWAFVSNADSRIDTNKNRIDPNIKAFGIIREKIRDCSGQGVKFVRNCLKVILATALIVSSYGILEHYGIDASLWVQDVRNRVFSTLGQPNWLAAYLAILIPVTISLFVTNGIAIAAKNVTKGLLYLSLYLLFVLCFLYTKSQSGLLGLSVSLVFFWAGLLILNLKNRFISFRNFVFCFLFFVFCFLFMFSTVGSAGFPQIDSFLKKVGLVSSISPAITVTQTPMAGQTALETGGSSSGAIRKVVWKGALEIWKHYPLFGSGVETFAYSYYNFRPVEHNLLSEWDFLYNKAHNEYLNFLATTGLVGLGTYLIFILAFIVWFSRICTNYIRTNPNNKTFGIIRDNIRVNSGEKVNLEPTGNIILLIGLSTGWLSILITNFFGFSVVPIALFFFLIPAFCFILDEKSDLPPQNSRPATNFPLSTSQKLSFIFLLFAICYLLFAITKMWRSDYHYAQGEKFNKSSQYGASFQELVKAINLNKGEPVYRNEIAQVAASLAMLTFQQEKDATSASKFAQVALSQSQKALETSPRNLNFWKGRVKVLFALAQINKEFFPATVEAIKQAISLAPTDPKLLYNLALLYSTDNKNDLAIETLKKTVDLKPNYLEPRFALATLFRENNQKEEAKKQLEYILKNINPEHSPSAELLEEM